MNHYEKIKLQIVNESLNKNKLQNRNELVVKIKLD